MEEKIQSLDTETRIRILNDNDSAQLSIFSCGDDELDEFFHNEMRECVDNRYLAAYGVFVGEELCGLFTLMNDSIILRDESERLDFIEDLYLEHQDMKFNILNRQPNFPAINIGHLGISLRYQGYGLGSMVLGFIIDTFQQFRISGCQFVTVDAINRSKITSFYQYNEFSFQTLRDSASSTRRMYYML